MRWVELMPHIAADMEKSLFTTNAIYNIKRIVMKNLTVVPGMRQYRWDNISTGPIPNKVILALSKHSAVLGDKYEHAFKFSTYGMREISLLKDGNDVKLPYSIANPNEDCLTTRCARAYREMFTSSGNGMVGNMITHKNFVNDMALFCYDLSSDHSSLDHTYINPVMHGSLSIKIQFEDNVTTPYNIIVFSQYNNTVEIDRLRNIILDY